LKAVEKGRTSAADGVPLAQPALALASALVGRAAKAGLDVPVPGVISEPEVIDADSIGDLLMAVVVAARAAKVDPEAALRAAARRYRGLVQAAEGVGR
jgi:XTP/dITP diphosphohydrolase